MTHYTVCVTIYTYQAHSDYYVIGNLESPPAGASHAQGTPRDIGVILSQS